MKRLVINHEYVKSMSTSRNRAIELASRYSTTLAEHVAKCVIYSNTTNNLEHWVGEISHKLSIVNQITLKPSGKKLIPKSYEDTIFDSMGTDKADVYILLEDLHYQYEKTYPPFDVTDGLIDRLFRVFSEMKKAIIPILSSKNDFVDRNFRSLIYDILNNGLC